MTPCWHDGPLATLDRGHHPVVWSIADDGAEARAASARALVAYLSGEASDRVRLARNATGAPRVDHPPGWHIGLSRRGGRCLIAAATHPIAVDREVIDDAPPLWDMLTAQEVRVVRAMPPEAQSAAWLRRWTIKEAHAKLIGEPRRLAPETIDTQVHDAHAATALCEGRSRCWTRTTGDAIETVLWWDDVDPEIR